MWNLKEMEPTSQLVIYIAIGFFLYQIVSWLTDVPVPRLSTMRGGRTEPSKGQSKLYLFYTGWCPHCTTLRCGESATEDDRPNGKPNPKSAWGKIFYKYQRHPRVTPVEVEADENRALAVRYDVEAYPTIILAKPDGTKLEYNGENTASGILKFLRKNLDE